MGQTALMVTGMEGVERCAAELAAQLGVVVDVAGNRRSALHSLGRREYSVVVVDHSLAESDPEGADLIWKHAGLAIPVQVNFAISGPARLTREVRAALARREQEQALSMRAAAAAIDTELKDAVTGFLLQSQLALTEQGLTPELEEKLKLMAELAGVLRQRLEIAQA